MLRDWKGVGVQPANRAQLLVMGDGRVGLGPTPPLDVRQEIAPTVTGKADDPAADAARIGRPLVKSVVHGAGMRIGAVAEPAQRGLGADHEALRKLYSGSRSGRRR